MEGVGDPAMSSTTAMGANMTTTTTLDPDVASEMQHTTDSRVLLLLLFLLYVTILVMWRFKVKRVKFLHETGVSLIIGFVVGYFVDLATPSSENPAICDQEARTSLMPGSPDIEQEAVFDPEIFFYVLLPPIIFFAGYDLKQKHFFRNLGVILLFAFLGTSIVCFVTGGMLLLYKNWFGSSLNTDDCFLFGALISATDPVTVLAIFSDLHVDDRLYAIVFGESVLNDAVAIVLYRSIEEYKPGQGNRLDAAGFFYSIWVFILIFFGSFAIGTLISMVSSAFFKFSDIKRYPLLETTMFVLLSYMSFLMGEGFGLSGIVSILFCGIGQAHYTHVCLSDESKKRTLQFFELLNFLAENFVFSYIGLNFFTYKCHRWDAGFISWSVFAVLVSRLFHVFPLSWVVNRFRKRNKVSPQFQYMLWWSGLRGAIAFALAMRNTIGAAHQSILTATLVVVLFTVVLFGGTTSAVINFLGISYNQHQNAVNPYVLADEGSPDNRQLLEEEEAEEEGAANDSNGDHEGTGEQSSSQATAQLASTPRGSVSNTPLAVERNGEGDLHQAPTGTGEAGLVYADAEDGTLQPSNEPVSKGWLARHWQGIDKRYIRPTISYTDDNKNMEGTDSWSSVLFAIRQACACGSASLPQMSPTALDVGNGAVSEDDDEMYDSEDVVMGTYDPSLPSENGDSTAPLSGDFTSFAVWNSRDENTTNSMHLADKEQNDDVLLSPFGPSPPETTISLSSATTGSSNI